MEEFVMHTMLPAFCGFIMTATSIAFLVLMYKHIKEFKNN